MLRYGSTEAFHLASADLAHRDNGRIQFHSDEIAAEIFNRVKVMLPETFEKLVPAGCSSNIRLYRYIEGQRFGKHVDESHDGENGERSVFTLLIYLNHEGLRGGETVFYKGNYGDKLALSYAPRAGSLLLHGHGSRCMVHEGKAVIEGQKYVLRTDVMYRRPKS
uniref:Fe2OG dioxygenase domain-containing protein n=1 Tax=Rhodosorus marinus TaxID=101924 RepID=A0A7S2Z9G1_9RHOD|mmetsp:Transcript_10271/g.42985  ORF Transcript_10271/g.42985 Transcript_10271/m.42985 type:complete len:164 (+) Transcript_10271:390-881(+)